MLLGRLVQETTGVGHRRLIEEHLAEPPGMNSTWVGPPESARSRLAVCHRVGNQFEHWYEVLCLGRRGSYRTDRTCSPLSNHISALTFAMGPRVRASETVEVALGWHIYNEPGASRLVYHVGSTMGSDPTFARAPQDPRKETDGVRPWLCRQSVSPPTLRRIHGQGRRRGAPARAANDLRMPGLPHPPGPRRVHITTTPQPEPGPAY